MSPKRDITMDFAEIDAFLRSQNTAIVVAKNRDRDRAPVGALGRLLYDRGHTAFAVGRNDPVVDLLTHDDRTCCIVEQFPSYYEIAGVMLHGRSFRQPSVGEDAIFYLDVEKVVSFDFSKLTQPSGL
jgi:hypothetical protein